MEKAYTEKQIKDMLNTNLLYKKDCINYKGKDEEGDYYIEYISKYIIDNIKKIKKNGELQYNESYVRNDFNFSHNAEDITFTENSNKYEANLCRYLFKNSSDLRALGKVVEYEANIIKGDHTNIDLVSYNENNGDLYLIEVKGTKDNKNQYKYNSDETLLRCILEISTYYNSIRPKMKQFTEDLENKTLNKIKNVKLAILAPEESKAYKAFKNKEEYKFTNSLLNNPITLEGEDVREIEVYSFEECGVPLDIIK